MKHPQYHIIKKHITNKTLLQAVHICNSDKYKSKSGFKYYIRCHSVDNKFTIKPSTKEENRINVIVHKNIITDVIGLG